MGVSGFDSSSMGPMLPPPGQGGLPNDQVKGKEGGKNAQEGKAILRETTTSETKGHQQTHGDGSQLYNEELEIQHDEHTETQEEQEQQQGGGGQSGSGDGGGSGTGSGGGQSDQDDSQAVLSLRDILSELDANTVTTKAGSKIATQFATKDVIIQASSDRNDTSTTTTGKNDLMSDFPHLAASKDFDMYKVLNDTGGNQWLNSSFMTTITANLLAVAKMKQDQQGIEGMMAAQLMNVFWDLGVALGDLALKKAELEAEMHMWEGIAGFIGLGITVGIAAMGVAGLAAGHVATAKMGKAGKGADVEGDSGFVGAGGGAKGGTEKGSFGSKGLADGESGTTTRSRRNSADEGEVKTTQHKDSEQKNMIGKAREDAGKDVEIGSNRSKADKESDADIAADEAGEQFSLSKDREKEAEAPVVNTNSKANLEGSSEQKSAGQGGPTSDQTETGAFIADDGTQKLTFSGEGKTEGWRNGTYWKDGKIKSREGSSGGLSGEEPGVPKSEVSRAEKVKMASEYMSSLSISLGQVGGQVGQIADNFVQMVFKPLIGEVERETQITQAAQNITKQMLDAIFQDIGTAGQSLDAALQALQKIQDETSRAQTYGRG